MSARIIGNHFMKTILFFHQSSELYGSDKVLLNIASGLDRSFFLPIVILPKPGPLAEALTNANVRVIFIPCFKVSRASFTFNGILKAPYEFCKSLIYTHRAVRKINADLIYTNTVAVLNGALYARLLKIPHIWHVHEVLLKPTIVRKLFPLLIDALSHKVISISGSTTHWLTSEVSGLKSKIDTIWNGIPSVNISERIGVNEKIIITLVGRINAWKGHHLLVEAAKILIDKGQLQIKFLIVGSVFQDQTYFIEDLKAHISKLELDDFFEFIPFTNNINSIWQRSDIAVVPSTEPEPFGLVAIEAMSNSLPVIAANHGGLTEIVENNVTGLLFKPRDSLALSDALGYLINNPKIRFSMGAMGKKRQVDFFSVNSQVDRITQTIKTLIN